MSEEANVDTIHAMADNFAQQMQISDVANEAYTEHKGGYIHLFIGGYGEDGFTQDFIDDHIEKLAKILTPEGWFVAKKHFDYHQSDDEDDDDKAQLMCFVDLFPTHGTPISLRESPWHVSPRHHRDSILAGGLQPSNGGSDHIHTQNARIYVALDDLSAEGFVRDMRRLRDGWDEVDYWKIDLAQMPAVQWFEDVEAPSAGAWTPTTIPVTALSLYELDEDVDIQPQPVSVTSQAMKAS